jgi:hypothetical protein
MDISQQEYMILDKHYVENLPNRIPDAEVICDSNYPGIAAYQPSTDKIIVGKKYVIYPPEARHGVMRHEKTHFAFAHLLPEDQQHVCNMMQAHLSPSVIEEYYRSKFTGDNPNNYLPDYWLNETRLQKSKEAQRGYFADCRMIIDGQEVYLPHVFNEMLASAAQNNDYSFRSDRSSGLRNPIALQAINALPFEVFTCFTKLGVLHVSAFNEVISADRLAFGSNDEI